MNFNWFPNFLRSPENRSNIQDIRPKSPEHLPNSIDYSKIPDDIWCEIFTYLSIDDRASIRPTCRRFYELCDDIRLQRNEEILFHGDRYTELALDVLLSSQRQIQNIRLHSIHVTDTFLPFFRRQGGNIHSLTFEKCKFQPGLFKGLVEHSKALQSLTITLDFGSEEEFPRGMHVVDDIRTLNENSITFDQVVDLKVKVNGPHDYRLLRGQTTLCSNQTIFQLFALFPNVRRVDLEFDVEDIFYHLSTISSDTMSTTQFTISSIYDRILALRNQLEKLRLHFNSCVTPQLLARFTQIEMKNVRELSLNWIDRTHSFTPNPFQEFQNLTHIDCDFRGHQSRNFSPTNTFLLLLSTISGLRSLVFMISHFRLSTECFEAIIRSRLSKLKIGDHVEVHFDESSIRGTLQPNHHLNHLSIETISTYCRYVFAAYFRSLEHLILSSVDEATLHTIFKNQNNVRFLKLHNGSSDNTFRDYSTYQKFLQNDDLSQNRLLPYLTHLFIRELQAGLSSFLLSEFKFPQLISLTLRMKRGGDKQFWQILSTVTQIKFLRLVHESQSDISFRKLSALVESLPHLCHIHILTPTANFRPTEYLKLFKVSSSLQIIVHNKIIYCYDAIDNTRTNVKVPGPHENSWRKRRDRFHSWPSRSFHALLCDCCYSWSCDASIHSFAYLYYDIYPV